MTLGWVSVFNFDRAIPRAILAPVAALAVIVATTDFARAQQYFNGAQTTPNAAINGGAVKPLRRECWVFPANLW